MSSLKAEINRILQSETSKVDSERQAKLTEIARKFSKIMSLGSQHIVKGSRHKTKNDSDFNDGAPSEETDEQLLQQFTEHSDLYETQVRDANLEKQSIREEISHMETEVRKMRDMLADKQTETKNLMFLLDREAELAEDKAQLEEKALKVLSDDLSEQISALEANNDLTGGTVTPYRMDQLLSNQHKKTIDSYEDFVAESENDLAQTQEELNTLQRILEKEQRVSAGLEHEKQLNSEELGRLGNDYSNLEKELGSLTYAFDQKQNELDKLRTQAGDDARKMAVELGKA